MHFRCPCFISTSHTTPITTGQQQSTTVKSSQFTPNCLPLDQSPNHPVMKKVMFYTLMCRYLESLSLIYYNLVLSYLDCLRTPLGPTSIPRGHHYPCGHRIYPGYTPTHAANASTPRIPLPIEPPPLPHRHHYPMSRRFHRSPRVQPCPGATALFNVYPYLWDTRTHTYILNVVRTYYTNYTNYTLHIITYIYNIKHSNTQPNIKYGLNIM